MQNYSVYRKDLDPFNKDFDAEKALKELDVLVPPSSSVDDFEQELMDTEETKELVKHLKKVEATKTISKHIKPLVGQRTRRNRFKQLAVQSRYEEMFRQTGVEYFDGIGFALAHGGPYDCLRKWVQNKTHVTIKIQFSSSKLPPNRCIQAVIFAYDRHWNLLVRECDEVFLPRKCEDIQKYENIMPPERQYSRIGVTNILSRYSGCILIMGQTIACIYDKQDIE
ncbi:hypothetical protein M3Y97_00516600 [Aphelenchoides bicaudatus]|nr:hypothetical protein M3Y97_00516600 [Aphelenchoides bicaudatus]